MRIGTSPRHSSTGFMRGVAGALALAGAVLIGSGAAAASPGAVPEPASLAPSSVATVAEGKCGPKTLSTPGVECRGWDATDIRSADSPFVVGFSNDQELEEKTVLQTVTTFDLAPIRAQLADGKVAHALLSFSEASTMRRSAAGDSDYGILETCNTALGVPTTPWNGNVKTIVKTTDAATDGFTGLQTGGAGSWDVTPQLVRWLEGDATQGTFVLRSADESLTPNAQAQCLSYVMDFSLNVEFAPLD
ncbi:MAG: hypothetical protein AB7P40_20650 [Chloroflexota bacterium]